MKISSKVKTVGGFIVSFTVGGLVTNLIENNTDTEDMGTVKKLCMNVGGLVVASMVASKAVKYFEETVDQVTLEGKKDEEPIKE